VPEVFTVDQWGCAAVFSWVVAEDNNGVGGRGEDRYQYRASDSASLNDDSWGANQKGTRVQEKTAPWR